MDKYLFQSLLSVLFNRHPEVELLGHVHMVILFLIFGGPSKLFSIALVSFLYSCQQYTRIPISPHPGSRLFSGFLIVTCRRYPLGGHSSALSTLTWPNSRCKPRARVTSSAGPAAGLLRTLNARGTASLPQGYSISPVCLLMAHPAPGARASWWARGMGTETSNPKPQKVKFLSTSCLS